ncbi:hypothetical protein CIB84_000487 [Bambusicola thoracicus]|uniref:Uncharacterized protein n=1 Tax=Bambusicola thoracicus TaxID=9083 RepID=A0A2P4THB8_BAMTH|nr:hypothetical protein CIB84_000487 [Bambusicola thoracicus]
MEEESSRKGSQMPWFPGVLLLDCQRVPHIQPYTFLTEVCCILGHARALCNLQKI